MATAVISARVDEGIRQRADLVMRKAGLKPTDIIQNVWAYMATRGEIPDVAKPMDAADDKQEALARLERFIASLPPANPAYAGWTDEQILALKASYTPGTTNIFPLRR